jgi:hypothetical protein
MNLTGILAGKITAFVFQSARAIDTWTRESFCRDPTLATKTRTSCPGGAPSFILRESAKPG